MTIWEAAERLGVKEDAILKHIQRGTLRHEKTPEGRVFVWVDAAPGDTQDTTQDTYRYASQEAVLSDKDGTIAAIREQLAQANERDCENRSRTGGSTLTEVAHAKVTNTFESKS